MEITITFNVSVDVKNKVVTAVESKIGRESDENDLQLVKRYLKAQLQYVCMEYDRENNIPEEPVIE